MATALIIEDEKRAARRLRSLIEICDPSIEVVGELESVKDSLNWLGENAHPDLIFSDIQLADGLSFEIYESVTIDSAIIFTTAYDQYAIRAFKANGIDYLLKPMDEDELCAALEKFKKWNGKEQTYDSQALAKALSEIKSQHKNRFVVKVGDKLKRVEADEVSAFYSMQKATFLCAGKGRNYAIDFSLDHLEDVLDPAKFFRVNRKYIAAMDAIEEIVVWSGSRLKLKLKGIDDDDLLVSRERTQEFKSWLEGE
ncbi:LytR/AlgR family response regulator transcription factor [Halocola ammonii]